MDLEKIEYLVLNLSNMCGVPSRIYKGGELVYFSSMVDFIKDPVLLDIDNLFKTNEPVTYFINDYFYTYGILNHGIYRVIVGPFRLITPDESLIQKISFDLGVEKERLEAFSSSMKLITNQPIETVIQGLCMIYFSLTDQKLSIKDIIVDEVIDKDVKKDIQLDAKSNSENDNNDSYLNNSYAIESQLMRIVENGDIGSLRSMIENIPAVRPGVLSKNLLRHSKNTFIAAVTVVSRSAIRGHMDVSEALALSDMYIQKVELMQNFKDINTLLLNMSLDYTERVWRIRRGKECSNFMISINKYINAHIAEPIKSDDLSKSLFISKSSLFEKVKKESGMSLSDYVNSLKMEEAKNLLLYTKHSLTAISSYLGFSSQSYFNRTFKKFMNMTPLEYKSKV